MVKSCDPSCPRQTGSQVIRRLTRCICTWRSFRHVGQRMSIGGQPSNVYSGKSYTQGKARKYIIHRLVRILYTSCTYIIHRLLVSKVISHSELLGFFYTETNSAGLDAISLGTTFQVGSKQSDVGHGQIQTA